MVAIMALFTVRSCVPRKLRRLETFSEFYCYMMAESRNGGQGGGVHC
jgi:hypothetical protein